MVIIEIMVEIVIDDITKSRAGAIVNAANSHLTNQAGVALAIAKAGGAAFQKEAERSVKEKGPIDTGSVREQKSDGSLNCDYVIHAVGPIYGKDREKEAEDLFSCYYNSIKKASNIGLQSISFPAISCGIFGYPGREAAQIAIEAIKKAQADFEFKKVEIWFLPTEDNIALAELFVDALNSHENPFWPYLSDAEKKTIIYANYPMSSISLAEALRVRLEDISEWYRDELLPMRKSIGEPEFFQEALVVGFFLASLRKEEIDSLSQSPNKKEALLSLAKTKR